MKVLQVRQVRQPVLQVRQVRQLLLAVLLSTSGCCVAKSEYAANVKAWHSFYDAVLPDLEELYGKMPEPSRSTRRRFLIEERDAIAAAESRALGASK
jgi:hypothetical protein